MSLLRKTTYWVPTIAWMALIYVQSSSSSLSSSDMLAVVGHFAEYSILSILFGFSLINTAPLKLSTAALLAVFLAASYGVADEVHQLFVPSRFGDLNDIAVDLLSSIAGSALFVFLTDRQIKKRAR